MTLLAIPLGALIGLSLGALGGGGSILTVPVLVYVLRQSAHGATTASLIIVGLTALAGMGAHLRARRVQVRSGLMFGVLGSGGSYLGSRLSGSIDPNTLLAAFSVLMAIAAASMLRRRAPVPAVAPRPELAPVIGTEPSIANALSLTGAPGAADRGDGSPTTGATLASPGTSRVAPLRVVIAASVVGLVTGFFGIGGGFVVVPALVLALGFDMTTAVGTSLLVIAINSASALTVRLTHHVHVDLALLITFTAAAIVGTLAGAKVASRSRPEKLLQAFALLLAGVAIYTASRSIPHLV